jgi:hypothetical protein
MNRRAFLRTLALGAAGLALDQAVPEVARCYFLPPPTGWTSTPSGLFQLHPDAIARMAKDLADRIDADGLKLYDRESRMSIRFVREFDVQISRMDILYGWAALAPDLAVPLLGG